MENMKRFILLIMIFFAAAALSGCEDYHATNEPRRTATSRASVLTALTSTQTSRPETYSEYISSLHEMESSIREEAQKTIGGMERDTAIKRDSGVASDTIERVTGVTRAVSDSFGSGSDSGASESVSDAESTRMAADTAVTTVPPISEEKANETVTCTAQTTPPPDDLSDIMPVPSGLVREN